MSVRHEHWNRITRQPIAETRDLGANVKFAIAGNSPLLFSGFPRHTSATLHAPEMILIVGPVAILSVYDSTEACLHIDSESKR